MSKGIVGLMAGAALVAAATLIPTSESVAQVRVACDPKPPMRNISDRLLKNCDIRALNNLISEYERIASHHWCRWGQARRAKEVKFDETTHQLVQAQIDSALALANATKGALAGPAGAKDSIDALGDIKNSLEHMSEASRIARAGFSDSAQQDEHFRLYENAEHHINSARKIRDQLEAKAATDPDCPPKEDKPGGSYSGFGITVQVLNSTTIRITSDCTDRDHRIQMRGQTGTWSTKGVRLSEVVVTDLDPDMTYSVRRRCDHEYSGVLTFPLSALKGR